MKRKLLASLLVCCGLSLARADEWIQNVEFKLDPPEDGKQVVTARLLPSRTQLYDLLTLECVYRQEIPWRDAKGALQTKVIEPVNFTYRRKEVKLTQDLDFYCSFRVPIGLDKLATAYGERTFSADAPVTINRVRVRAYALDKPLWSYEFAVPGAHTVVAPPPPPPERKPPADGGFGSVDLD